MAHDSSKDPRLLVAQRACRLLRQTLQQKTHVKMEVGKEKLLEMAGAAESAVMALTYSYLEPAELAGCEAMQEVVGVAGSLAEALRPVLTSLAPAPLLQANLRWCLRTLDRLPGRISASGTSLASGVDLVAVEVRNVAKSGDLWLTRVSDGRSEIPVVTNIPGIRTGDRLAVAFLPPREVGGTLSEAMYLGEEKRTEEPGTLLTDELADAREASSILHEEIAKH